MTAQYCLNKPSLWANCNLERIIVVSFTIWLAKLCEHKHTRPAQPNHIINPSQPAYQQTLLSDALHMFVMVMIVLR